jgi:hypothetical protein
MRFEVVPVLATRELSANRWANPTDVYSIARAALSR